MDRDSILKATHDLQERFILSDKSAFGERTIAHLHRGFIVRVMMIQHATVDIDVELNKAEGPLSSYLSIELSLLLNSFYLHLAGSLDNLAWALGYHYDLKQGLNERSREDRRFIGLFNAEFIASLEAKGQNALVSHLRLYKDWNNDLKTFRDPGAHRIPLFVPPAIYSESDVALRKTFDLEAADHISKGNHEKGVEAFHKMAQLGVQYPIFFSEVPEIVTYHVGPKLTEDFATWFQITDKVFEKGFGLKKLS